MKRVQITFFLACTILAMAGCLDSYNTEPTEVVDPSVRSYYYIANQSELDLSVTYKIAFLPMDSTVSVPGDSTTQIFNSGGFSFPTPSEALANIRFYTLSGDTSSPILTIEPIVDENWNDVTAETVEFDTTRKYELVITEGDL